MGRAERGAPLIFGEACSTLVATGVTMRFWLCFAICALHADVLLLAQSTCPSQPSSAFYLSKFPLPNRTAYSASINSVMDHSMTNSYTSDNVVIGFTGELANLNPEYATTINGQTFFSFQNMPGIPFVINGQYIGAGTPTFLNYDGHPGIDYKTTDQDPSGEIPVYAAASGTLHVDTGEKCCHALYIDHGNCYKTYYLHLSSWVDPNTVEGRAVSAGDMIGVSGSVGVCTTDSPCPHLHFEVRYNGVPVDPYGWQGRYLDPRTVRSTTLWAPARTAAPNVIWHPDGSLVSYNGTVYLIQAGKLRGIPSPAVFYAYGFDFGKVISVGLQEIQALPQGSLLGPPPAAFLVNDGGTIYEVTDQHYKRGITSQLIFDGVGFRWSDIQQQSTATLLEDPTFRNYTLPYREGSILCTLDSSGHGCATNSTYYVVSDGQIAGFATATAFTSLGYVFTDAFPVPASLLTCPGSTCSSLIITDAMVKGSTSPSTLPPPSNLMAVAK